MRKFEVDEALMWQNAVAFATRGDGSVAVGLSNILRKSNNIEIGQRSAEIIRFFADRGVDPRTTLKDPWNRSFLRKIALFVAAFAAPAAAIAFFVLPTSSPGPSANSWALDPSTVDSSDSWKNVFVPSAAGTAETVPETQPTPIPTCESPPESGEILLDNRSPAADGHVLQIKNGSVADAIIKLRDASTNSLVASFFVGRGKTASLSGISDGDYFVQYAAGDKLAEDCRKFVDDGTASASQFPGPENLTTRYEEVPEGPQIVRGQLTYTLYSVPFGNVRPSHISMEEFDN